MSESTKNQVQQPIINGYARSIRELLNNKRYGLEYYQREYSWEQTQVEELVNDLIFRFSDEREEGHDRRDVASYRPYFLGPIITSSRDGVSYLIDGQQRLTTLSLLFIHILRRLDDEELQSEVRRCIYSARFGERSFTLDVSEREPCMIALLQGTDFDTTDSSPSVRNIWHRFGDVEKLFEVEDDDLPLFIDWLLERVVMVEITTSEGQMAYEIFETMNDRGLNLTPTDMLKSYLLANIGSPDRIRDADAFWRNRVKHLADADKNADADFFKSWLRAHYAASIRERKKHAAPRDFDRIGTEFHKWVRENQSLVGIAAPTDFEVFVRRKFDRMSQHYIRLLDAQRKLTPGLEHVRYNAETGFTLQLMVALAPVTPDDDDNTANVKMELVARYLDTFVARRMVNYRNFGYSTVQYTMFILAKEIRGVDVPALRGKLAEQVGELDARDETFEGVPHYRLHQRNGRHIRYLLARLTDFIERECKGEAIFDTLINRNRRYPFEIEHIWANRPERHADAFDSVPEFEEARNRFGGLLLLPKDFNASYGDRPYEEKLPHYRAQNLLAASLHPATYELNPLFTRFIAEHELPFRPYPDGFRFGEMEERQELYRQLCETVWSTAPFYEVD